MGRVDVVCPRHDIADPDGIRTEVGFMRFKALSGVLALAAVVAHATHAAATGACAAIDRSNLLACALARNPAIVAGREDENAAEGRRTSANTLLPSAPVLSVSAARRTEAATNRSTVNWTAALSQELEIGGQRGARRRVATADQQAGRARLVMVRLDVAAAAWQAYFSALAADARVETGRFSERIARRVERAALEMESSGAIAGAEADVASVGATQAVQRRLAAERRLATARAALAAATGSDPGEAASLRVSGALDPIPGVEAYARRALSHSVETRPEVRALRAEQRGLESRAALYARTRYPNPTLSLFVGQDGFSERVIGAGVSIPLYLPYPLARTWSGEIAEARALARRAGAEADLARRDLRLRLVQALADFESRKAALSAIPRPQVERARRTLADIAGAITARRLGVRDAVLTRQTLIELLDSDVTTRLELCLASVELARASGFPLDGRTS